MTKDVEFYERQSGEIIADAPSGIERKDLKSVIPLDVPFAVHLFPVYACNLRCEFCIWTLDEKDRGYLSDVKVMPFDLYKRAIDGLKDFPSKLGLWRIAGVGEPLMHPQIVEMVEYAAQSEMIDRVEIVTNGTLLTPELSEGLINAGLTRLRVSVEGNSAHDYERYAKKKWDYESLVQNLEYYYKNRKCSKLYVKVMDYMLENKASAKEFVDRFEPISDALQIEHLTPVIKGIDFEELAGNSTELNIRQTGGVFEDVSVCALPFYMLQLNPDGKVFPCCSFRVPDLIGRVQEESMAAIWNGPRMKAFRIKMLETGAAGMGGICTDCNYYKYIMQDSDVLDGHEASIKSRLK